MTRKSKYVVFCVTDNDFKIVRSQRGALILVHDGYKYRQNYKHGPRVSWRCVRKDHGCRGSATTLGSELNVTRYHSHGTEDSSE